MSGDAFKEAHGGGTIFGFIDMLVNATFTLNGAPKPAFWHGLLPISVGGDMSDRTVEDGWRVVDADGKNKLDSEAFTVSNRFSVAEGSEIDFEQRCGACTPWGPTTNENICCAQSVTACVREVLPHRERRMITSDCVTCCVSHTINGALCLRDACTFAITITSMQVGGAGEQAKADAGLQSVHHVPARWQAGG